MTLAIVAFLVLLVLLCMAGWLWHSSRPLRRPSPPSVPRWARGEPSRPFATGRSPGRSDLAAELAGGDAGPETVLSYLHQHDNTSRPSGFAASQPDGFAMSTRPQTWPRGAEDRNTIPGRLQAATGATGQRGAEKPRAPAGQAMADLAEAVRSLDEGPADQAWASLQGHFPEPEQRVNYLQTLDRIAQAFEHERRFDAARDVYEHMADIDPQWQQVKLRLMRARGLAQAATANTWGTVGARPLPQEDRRQLGKYVVEKEIGRGAMGAVYLGYDPTTDHRVALKTMALAREFQGDELADARSRFLREAEMAGRLEHPDIVGIIGAGEADGLAFIAMELIKGTDLSVHATPQTLLPLTQLLPIMARVADALGYAHTRGVTHRDIKPANIMVDLSNGGVKVMDFGVARVADAARTRTGVVLGTPRFMSPEQLSGQTIDGRTDLYSLGVTLFQLLTGYLPYRNESMAQLMRAIAQDPVPNVCDLRDDLPRALGDIVALALQKHPSMRYANGQQMAEDLRTVAQQLSLSSNVDIDLG